MSKQDTKSLIKELLKELIENNEIEIEVLPSNDANEKVSEMPSGSPIVTTDVIPFVRDDGGTETNYKGPVSDIVALGSTGISPYQAILDGVGTLANHYISFNPAYTANKAYCFTSANITETTSTTLTSASEGIVQVGPKNTWDLGANQIIGTSGNDFTIILIDGSSTFQFSTTPFVSFDALSNIVINGNGGKIQNTSTTANTYIYSAGALLANNIKGFLLPNASAGGFRTDLYTNLNNIVFVGGGSSCDKAIVANGGKISNVIFNGNNWATDAFIADITTKQTVWDTVYVDINAPVTLPINGSISKLSTNPANTSGFLTVNLSENSSIIQSYADSVVLISGITGCKIQAATTLGSLSLANDNSTQIDVVGVTFNDNVQVYGNFAATHCHFNGGIELMSGSTVRLDNCDSVNAMVNHGATSLIRAGNTPNIGNDYGTEPAILVETGSAIKISAMADPTNVVGTDKFPMIRAGANYAATIDELIEAIPGGASSMLMESGASEKMSAMPAVTTLLTTDIFPVVNSSVNKSCTIQKFLDLIPVTGSYDPFDAKVTANGQIEDDIHIGNDVCINVAAEITLEANIELNGDTVIYCSAAGAIHFANFRINCNGYKLTLNTDYRAVLDFTGAVPAIYSSTTPNDVVVNGFQINNLSATTNNYFIDPVSCIPQVSDCVITDTTAPNSGLYLAINGSFVKNCSFITSYLESGSCLRLSNGAYGEAITIVNLGAAAGYVVEIGVNTYIDGLDATANAININCLGNLSNVQATGTGINLFVDDSTAPPNANGAKISNCNFLNADIEGASTPVYMATCNFSGDFIGSVTSSKIGLAVCSVAGTYANACVDTKIAACFGSIL